MFKHHLTDGLPPQLGSLQPTIDKVSFSLVISACEGAACWPTALDVLSSMALVKLQANVVAFGAAISSCEKKAGPGWGGG